MNNLSNDRLKELSNVKMICMCQDEEYQSMARELLAYREAQGKAVACEFGESNGDGSYSVVYGRYPIPSHIKVSSDWPIKLFYAAPQLPAVPDGWALVPLEATPEMLGASWVHHSIHAPNAWRTMVAAAPKPDSDNVTDNTAQKFESLSKRPANE